MFSPSAFAGARRVLHRATHGCLVWSALLVACGSGDDRGHAGKAAPNPSSKSAGAGGVVAACDTYCSRNSDCDPACVDSCRDSFDPFVVRDTYLKAYAECASCSPDPHADDDCRASARAQGSITKADAAFCAKHGSTFEPCLLDLDAEFTGCEDWTLQVADAALELFAPCMTYPGCEDIVACIDRVFARERPEGYANSCETAKDRRCDEPSRCEIGTDTYDCEHADPKNRCSEAYNDKCDGPDVCTPGTDTYDCEGVDRGNRCALAYDNACNEPNTCEPGTDTYDCDMRAPYGRCEHAYDGVCDGPDRCPPGTDSADCAPAPDPCASSPGSCCDADAGACCDASIGACDLADAGAH